MSAPRRSFAVPALPSLLALMLVAHATSAAFAAAGRLERPVTDAVPASPAIAPRPPFVFSPMSGPRILDPANPMREISPGVYEGIVPVQQADGMWRIDLDERFLLFSVARRAGGGGFTHSCVSGLDGFVRWQAAVQPKVTTPTGTIRTQWEAQ